MALVILSKLERGVCTLKLNAPQCRNAMGLEMAAEFQTAIGKLKQRAELRAVIITGAGTAFAAGGDLLMLQKKTALDEATNRRLMLEFYQSFLCLLELPVPVIAAVNGHAIGAGLCLALACEARIVAATAKLGLTFTQIGLHPGMGATLFLPRLAGAAAANELLISGRVFDATEAGRLGLANDVVEPAQVVERSRQLADSFLAGGRDAIAGLLATLRPSPELLQVSLEREAAEQARNYAGAEFRERIALALQHKSDKNAT